MGIMWSVLAMSRAKASNSCENRKTCPLGQAQREMTKPYSGLSVDADDLFKYIQTIDQCVQKLVPLASFYWML